MRKKLTKPENKKADENAEHAKISWLEEPARDEWFLERTDGQGCPVVYLRMCVTGLLPRIIGPFASRDIALRFLDELIDEVDESMSCSAANLAENYVHRHPFHRRISPVLIQDPLVWPLLPEERPRTPKPTSQKPPNRKRKAA